MLVGIILAGMGILLAIVIVRLFKLKGGDETHAPWDPIKNFIAEGPGKKRCADKHNAPPFLKNIIVIID